jgi:hypothetical protein
VEILMRNVLLAVAALTACTPEIAPGAYFCGPDRNCPEGQQCDGPTNTCVLPSQVQAFACDPGDEHEPDNTPAQAFPLVGFTCATGQVISHGCLAAGDGTDWYQVTVPTGCTAGALDLQLASPIAFEPLDIELFDATGATSLGAGGTCLHQSTIGPGDVGTCVHAPVTPGTAYALQVRASDGDNCNGACNYNRYTLTVMLALP